MRKIGLSLLLIGALLGATSAVSSAGTSSDPATAAGDAAAWLGTQVDANGLVVSDFNALSASAQAVLAYGAAGVGASQVDAILDALETRVNDMVVVSGNDDPGALAYLILAALTGDRDPEDFGPSHANLVTRLQATLRTTGTDAGLYGAAFPGFDGVTRQGLALWALAADGEPAPAAAVTWLMGQQCTDATFDGLWPAYRDPAVACAIDLVNFSGPDTNSTAVAMLGLMAQSVQGDAVDAAADALDAVRTSDGGWGFFADDAQATDANSTGLVAEALLALDGEPDAEGTAALLALQVGCTAAAADRGAVAFQSDPDGLDPNVFATIQAIPALAGTSRLDIAGAPTAALPTVCAPVTTTTSTSTSTSSSSTSSTVAASTSTTAAAAIPKTGANDDTMALVALAFIGLGLVAVGRSRLQTR